METNILHAATTAAAIPGFLGMSLEKATLVIAFTTGLSSFLIGFAQIGLITWGLRQMRRSSNERDKQLAQQAETLQQQASRLEQQALDSQRRHEQAQDDSQRRHEQAMTALHALIERMGPRPPEPSTG